LKGVFIRDLEINAEEEGELSMKGVDVTFSVEYLSGHAETDDNVINGRLKVNLMVEMNIDRSNKSFRVKMLAEVDNISHEAFYHGFLLEQRFLKTGIAHPYRHRESSSELASQYFRKNGGGLSVLTEVQNFNIRLNSHQIKNSSEKLWKYFMMPGFGYFPEGRNTPPVPH
jgi:hypothetical protein